MGGALARGLAEVDPEGTIADSESSDMEEEEREGRQPLPTKPTTDVITDMYMYMYMDSLVGQPLLLRKGGRGGWPVRVCNRNVLFDYNSLFSRSIAWNVECLGDEAGIISF